MAILRRFCGVFCVVKVVDRGDWHGREGLAGMSAKDVICLASVCCVNQSRGHG